MVVADGDVHCDNNDRVFERLGPCLFFKHAPLRRTTATVTELRLEVCTFRAVVATKLCKTALVVAALQSAFVAFVCLSAVVRSLRLAVAIGSWVRPSAFCDAVMTSSGDVAGKGVRGKVPEG